MRFKGLKGIAVCLLSIAGSVGAVRASDQAQLLVDAFGNSCTSFRSYTQAALKYQNAFAEILQTIQKDEDCTALKNHLDVSKILGQHLQVLYSDPVSLERDSRRQKFLTDVVSELSFDFLNPSAGEMTLAEIGKRFPTGNFTQAFAKALLGDYGRRIEADQTEIERRKLVNQEVANYIEGLSGAIAQNRQCLLNRPNVASLILGQALVLGGFYSNNELGGALVLAGSILNELTYSLASLPVAFALERVQKSKLFAAISCGAEAISTTYCEAQSAKALLAQNVTTLGGVEQAIGEAWRGLELLSRDILVLQRWIEFVEAGKPASNPFNAMEKIQILQKSNAVLSSKQSFSARLEDARTLLADATGATSRNSIIQSFVNNLVGDFGLKESYSMSSSGSSPYAEQYPSTGYCGFQVEAYTGSNQIPPKPDQSPGNCYEYQTLVSGEAQDLEKVASNVQVIMLRVEERVNKERARKVIYDPLSIIAGAYKKDANGRSAVVVLEKISQYLTNLLRLLDNPPEGFDTSAIPMNKAYCIDTRAKSDAVLRILRESEQKVIEAERKRTVGGSDGNNGAENDASITALVEIGRIFQTTNDVTYFTSRIRQLVDWDVLNRVRSGGYDDAISTVIRLAVEDIITSVAGGNNPGSTLNDILRDVNKATAISQTTIDEYLRLLGPYIIEGIEHYRKNAVRLGERLGDPFASNYQNAAELCILAMTTNDSTIRWSISKNFKGLGDVCRDLTLYSVHYSQSKLAISWQEVSRQPQKDRMCVFRNFRRKSRVFETQALILNEK